MLRRAALLLHSYVFHRFQLAQIEPCYRRLERSQINVARSADNEAVAEHRPPCGSPPATARCKIRPMDAPVA